MIFASPVLTVDYRLLERSFSAQYRNKVPRKYDTTLDDVNINANKKTFKVNFLHMIVYMNNAGPLIASGIISKRNAIPMRILSNVDRVIQFSFHK